MTVGEDHFSDFNDEEQGLGTLENNDLVKRKKGLAEKLMADGYHVQVSCWMCGRDYDVKIDWPEMVHCGENGPQLAPSFPDGWDYSRKNNTMYLKGMCGCGGGSAREPTVCPHFTPDECRKHVKSALSAGFVSPQLVAQVQQAVAARRGGAR